MTVVHDTHTQCTRQVSLPSELRISNWPFRTAFPSSYWTLNKMKKYAITNRNQKGSEFYQAKVSKLLFQLNEGADRSRANPVRLERQLDAKASEQREVLRRLQNNLYLRQRSFWRRCNDYSPLMFVSNTETLTSLSKSRVSIRMSLTRRNSEWFPITTKVSNASISVRE